MVSSKKKVFSFVACISHFSHRAQYASVLISSTTSFFIPSLHRPLFYSRSSLNFISSASPCLSFSPFHVSSLSIRLPSKCLRSFDPRRFFSTATTFQHSFSTSSSFQSLKLLQLSPFYFLFGLSQTPPRSSRFSVSVVIGIFATPLPLHPPTILFPYKAGDSVSTLKWSGSRSFRALQTLFTVFLQRFGTFARFIIYRNINIVNLPLNPSCQNCLAIIRSCLLMLPLNKYQASL